MPRDGAKRGAQSALYGEHMLLGARFGEGRSVLRYHGEPQGADLVATLEQGCVLGDVSDAQVLVLWGDPVVSFAEAAFAGKRLAVGECAFEAVLTGDGAVASVPLLARTGDREYVCADLWERSEVLAAWLSFLGSVDQGGERPFAGLGSEDASGAHVALLLWGREAIEVLADYVTSAKDLPANGCISSCALDRIPCIVARRDLGDYPAYVVLVPPVHAVTLWRSILSFGQVTPVGRKALRILGREALPWTASLVAGDSLRMDASTLEAAGLVRADETFVGARGIRVHDSGGERGAS